ncbi:MAG: dihydroorotate dehydrogenase electron transfer subunit [Pirellula sp.]|nr:dihydroorotate dehydrogenase electron transfer subunit [Pirellula sp.]
MTNADCVEPKFVFHSTHIIEHKRIAADTWQLTFYAPDMAARALPGQFFMLRIAGQNDPLIGRALAMFDRHRDASGTLHAISVVYTVKGRFTTAMARRNSGDPIEVWGPLGNAFSAEPVEHLILVAGGVGQTPMLTYAAAALGLEEFGASYCSDDKKSNSDGMKGPFASKVTLCYGARTKEQLAGVDQFKSVCSEVIITTEDGSAGIHGRVTTALDEILKSEQAKNCRIACCGPEPMMHAVSKMAESYGVPCQVSLETPMACGIGICFTCVAKVIQPDGQWDYKRTCVEGPIFDSTSICWE